MQTGVEQLDEEGKPASECMGVVAKQGNVEQPLFLHALWRISNSDEKSERVRDLNSMVGEVDVSNLPAALPLLMSVTWVAYCTPGRIAEESRKPEKALFPK